jgi:hypothetical protein
MIDLNKYFDKYNEKIKLDDSRCKQLRTSRDALRDKIKKDFSDNGRLQPDFKGQGSFTMGTTINPKDTNDAYDIDYGVYLSEKDVIKDDGNWITPATVHDWIFSAVENQTSQTPENKNKCVRVKYAPGETSYSYHIDLPIYVECDGKCYLAVKNTNEWVESDPRAIVDWFRDEIKEENKSEQLRLIVRFVKSWVKSKSWNCKKPTGLLLTVLCAENFVKHDDGICDLALYQTVGKIKTFLDDELKKGEGNYFISNPVASENLLNEYTESALKEFKEKIETFYDNLDNALSADTNEDVYKYLSRIFNDMDEIDDISDEQNNYLKTKAPAIIGNDGRSA